MFINSDISVSLFISFGNSFIASNAFSTSFLILSILFSSKLLISELSSDRKFRIAFKYFSLPLDFSALSLIYSTSSLKVLNKMSCHDGADQFSIFFLNSITFFFKETVSIIFFLSTLKVAIKSFNSFKLFLTLFFKEISSISSSTPNFSNSLKSLFIFLSFSLSSYVIK